MKPLHALAVLATVVLAGCGKPGPPQPPEPRGPFPASGVTARQLGSTVVVAFEVPRPRGSRPAQQPARAELVRVEYAPGIQTTTDTDVFRRRGRTVAVVEAVPLVPGQRVRVADASLDGAGEPALDGWTLRYGVRVLDARGRPSPLVVARDLVPVDPPPPPAGLRGEATADGIRLTWTPVAGVAAPRYNVYRWAPDRPVPEQPLNATPLAAAEFLDPGVETGSRYAYEVRTTLTAELPYRESAPSATAEVLAEDRFAPAAPTGLVAVQEGPAVRLFWDPNGERDLDGYRVYRSRPSGAWERVGPETVQQALFLDGDVRAGDAFRYRVTAVDRATPPNESEPSPAVELDIVADPAATGPGSR